MRGRRVVRQPSTVTGSIPWRPSPLEGDIVVAKIFFALKTLSRQEPVLFLRMRDAAPVFRLNSTASSECRKATSLEFVKMVVVQAGKVLQAASGSKVTDIEPIRGQMRIVRQ